MNQLTMGDVLSAFVGVSGVGIQQAAGISLMVVSQVEFKEGMTQRAEVVLKQQHHFIQHGHTLSTQYLGLNSNYDFIDRFDHDDVRDGEGITANQILECLDVELINYLKQNKLKVFWGDSENGHIEVEDIWHREPTRLYFFGQTHDT